jgi:hypothetical protein
MAVRNGGSLFMVGSPFMEGLIWMDIKPLFGRRSFRKGI